MSDDGSDALDRVLSLFAPREEYTCSFCSSAGYAGRILFRTSDATICADCVDHLSGKLNNFTYFLRMEPENKTRH